MKAVAIATTTEPKSLESAKPQKQPKSLRALRTKLKPYFETKGVKLYCADYREILPTLKAGFVDAVITDPPYAITNLAWDRAIDWPRFWTEVDTVTRPTSPVVLFASGKFVHQLINTNPKNFRYDLIWEKNLAVGFYSPISARSAATRISLYLRGGLRAVHTTRRWC